MNPELEARLLAGFERPARMGMVGGDLREQIAFCASWLEVISRVLPELRDDNDASLHGVDLGTGAGLPGVVLAAMVPAWHWSLVEVRAGRATEVERTIARLRLPNCTVVNATAQAFARGPVRATIDVVVARAFGPPSLVAECAAPLLSPGGVVIVSDPPHSDAGRWPATSLSHLGLAAEHHVLDDRHHFTALRRSGPVPDVVPRVPPRDRGWYHPTA